MKQEEKIAMGLVNIPNELLEQVSKIKMECQCCSEEKTLAVLI